MIKFLFETVVVFIMFIILFGTTHNMKPSEIISRIINSAKELWIYLLSAIGNNDEPMNPYL